MARLVFRVHAVQRMFQRGIRLEDIQRALSSGEVIEAYPDDQPYPSKLVLSWIGPRPIHLVVADNIVAEEVIVITVYEPDPAMWEPGFRRQLA